MAITLNGINQYLDIAQRVVGSSFPFTIVAYVANVGSETNGGSERTVVSMSQLSADKWVRMSIGGGNSSKFAGLRYNTDANATKTTPPDFSDSNWNLQMGVYNTTSQALWFGDTSEEVNPATVTDQTGDLNTTSIGVIQRNTSEKILYYKGSIAEVHFYNRALTDTDYIALTTGTLPENVADWIDGWTLLNNSDLTSISGTRTLSAYNSPTTSALPHPISRGVPTLSAPTVVSTGNTISTVRVTTDVAPSGSSTLAIQVLPAATATPTAAAILAAPTLTITSGATGARDFNLTGLTNGTAYRAHFAQTGPSNVVSTASFTPSTVPGAPTIGTATVGNAQATVNGTAPASNGGSAITGYRSTATPGGSTVTGVSLPITHTGLTNGTAYTFTLAAQNANGFGAESASSNSVTPTSGGDTTNPTMTGVVSSSGITSAGATISWSAGSDNVAVTGYEYRLNGGSYVSVGNVLTTALSGLTPSTAYTVDVRAFDAAGNRSTAITGNFTTSAASDTTPPTLTGSITVGTVTASSVQISWPAGSDNVAVTAYEVSSNGGTSYSNVGNVLTFTFTGLSPSTSYSFRVRARDAAGNVSSALSVTQSTNAGSSIILKRIVVVLTTKGTAPAASLVNLKWAFFDENRPDLFNGPSCQGATEITDLSGVLEIDVTDSSLAIGQTGWLIITDSDGTVFQNPPAKAFSAPVQVIAAS
jgi:chitodextrinase